MIFSTKTLGVECSQLLHFHSFAEAAIIDVEDWVDGKVSPKDEDEALGNSKPFASLSPSLKAIHFLHKIALE